jgi:hypothetical protein
MACGGETLAASGYVVRLADKTQLGAGVSSPPYYKYGEASIPWSEVVLNTHYVHDVLQRPLLVDVQAVTFRLVRIPIVNHCSFWLTWHAIGAMIFWFLRMSRILVG